MINQNLLFYLRNYIFSSKNSLSESNIEKDAGLNSYFDNAAYEKAGAKIVDDPNAIYRDADVILKVNAPTPAEIGQMKKDSILISMMYASTNQAIV